MSYETISIEHAGASFSVTTFGGHLLSYTPPSHPTSVLWLSSSHARDMSRSIRGGVPVCFPQFGRAHDKISPQHGFARVQRWTLVSRTSAGVTMALSSAENQAAARPAGGMWPAGPQCPYRARLTLSLSLLPDGSLSYAMAVKNEAETAMPYQLLLHNYFSADSQAPDFGVAGLAGYSVVDTQPRGREGEGQAYFVQGEGPVVVDGEVDRIFHGPGPVGAAISRGGGGGELEVTVTA
ncbi:hypothetical protein TeGR_g11990, partial [Tetraparma gracilis]